MSFKVREVLLAAGIALTSGAPAIGATVTYGTFAEFDTAVNIQSTQNFEGAALGSYGSGGLVLGDLQFFGYDGFGGYFLNVVGPLTPPVPYNNWGSGQMLKGPDPFAGRDRKIYIDFSHVPGGGVFAFGFNLMLGGAANGSTQIRLSTGETLAGTTTGSYPNQVFWGASSETLIAYAEILSTTQDGSPIIDNVAFGALDAPAPLPTSETAEVMTMVYIGSGLLALRGMARRKKLNSAQAG